jgi:16S rRNA processing protein RimM
MRSQQYPLDASINSSAEPELFDIARITRTRGLKGEVVAAILTDFPERFAERREVCLHRPDGQPLKMRLEHHWFHRGRLILKFAGCDTIEQAQLLVGSTVKISQNELAVLEDDEFFHFQLVGCQVETMSGNPVGRVVKVVETGGTPILTINDAEGREHLIPFASSICLEVDIRAGRIQIDPPEGLLDL